MAYRWLQIGFLITLLGAGLAPPALAQQSLRDPTQPPVVRQQTQQESDPVSAARQLTLNAVVIGVDQATARLGTHTVSVGQRVLGATVLAIHPDHVVMRDDDGDFRLSWPRANMVSPSQETPEA